MNKRKHLEMISAVSKSDMYPLDLFKECHKNCLNRSKCCKYIYFYFLIR